MFAKARGNPASQQEKMTMRRIVMLLTLGSCVALAGCDSWQLTECRKANPPGSPGYDNCWQAELHRQNEEANRRRALEFRAKD